MLTGVEILLERMKTNPEEFIEGGYSKWARVISGGWDIFTAEEQKALQEGMSNAKREHFNGEVMRVLAGHMDVVTSDEYLFRKSSKIIAPQNMIAQATQILNNEFDKAYAKNAKTKTPRTPKA
jgi:hypothetical protein